MQTNDRKIRNYSNVLAQEYGQAGTPERERFQEEAYAFYSGLIILQARKDAHLTQAELAQRIGADKSYISRIEKGVTIPSVATFFKIISAMGMSIAIVQGETQALVPESLPVIRTADSSGGNGG